MPENIAEHSASISNPKSRLIVKQVKIILLSFQKKTRETTFKKKKVSIIPIYQRQSAQNQIRKTYFTTSNIRSSH